MKYRVTLNGKIYEVVVERGEAVIESEYELSALLPAAPVSPAAAAPVASAPSSPSPAVNAGDGEAVKSPLPGIVLNVTVAPGQRVEKGQLILTLEAMKMENEIVAPRSGTVGTVAVSKGVSVKTGDPLITIN